MQAKDLEFRVWGFKRLLKRLWGCTWTCFEGFRVGSHNVVRTP